MYPTRAPTTLACAAYRLGAVSVFRKRRGTAEKVLGEMRIVLRRAGAKIREAIVDNRMFNFCRRFKVFILVCLKREETVDDPFVVTLSKSMTRVPCPKP